ncbi:MAG: NHLP leader peptide family natural product precursor [Chloroflexi bacterium]|nr:NHLP leader peptide family natural product precursor [Chloroflexota bacterium]
MANRTISEMKAHLVAKADASEDFRTRLVADPRSVISAEFGISIPEGFAVHVHEDGATTAHMVLPMSDRLTEDELATVAAGVDVYPV